MQIHVRSPDSPFRREHFQLKMAFVKYDPYWQGGFKRLVLETMFSACSLYKMKDPSGATLEGKDGTLGRVCACLLRRLGGKRSCQTSEPNRFFLPRPGPEDRPRAHETGWKVSRPSAGPGGAGACRDRGRLRGAGQGGRQRGSPGPERVPRWPTPPPGQEKQHPGGSQQVWAATHHCGKPHGGVYEELEGLGRSLLDSPKSHRHAGGAQDYEGEPKHLGKWAGIRLVGERKMAAFLPVPANWTGTPRPTGQWPQVGHCNVPA